MVKDGTHKQSGDSFAIKIVTKAKLTHEDEEALKDEIAVLKELKHQHIIRLYDVFDEAAVVTFTKDWKAFSELKRSV